MIVAYHGAKVDGNKEEMSLNFNPENLILAHVKNMSNQTGYIVAYIIPGFQFSNDVSVSNLIYFDGTDDSSKMWQFGQQTKDYLQTCVTVGINPNGRENGVSLPVMYFILADSYEAVATYGFWREFTKQDYQLNGDMEYTFGLYDFELNVKARVV